MIAYHFPPQGGSSGIQRTLRFARYLPEFGWEPHVLTVHPTAYETLDENQEISPDVTVHRSLAFDASRHFAIGSRYPSALARPDRWATWWWSAVPKGLKVVRKWRPQALWSTYPIATAHAIGHTLARLTNLPWVADFRDPMAQGGYPPDPRTWRIFHDIESRAVRRASRSVFVTHGAADEYRARYPEQAQRIAIIENGYDEEMFDGTSRLEESRRASRPIVILHSGIVYPLDRDPTAFMKALKALRGRGEIAPGDVEFRFRAPVHDTLIRRDHGVEDLITIVPHLPYSDALQEMQQVDALMIMQAAICNQQIPAKFYEYVRAGRPLVGLADPSSDTARAMREAGATHIAALEDPMAIEATLLKFLHDYRSGRTAMPGADYVRRASRRVRTGELAHVLDQVAGIRH
jgi:glycosyltransferase involved in cell wall biosynthesis